MSVEGFSTGTVHERLARARAAGRSPAAGPLWRDLVATTSIEEQDYRRCCEALVEVYRLPGANRPNATAALLEYLGDLGAALEIHRKQGNLRDVARLHAASGRHGDAMEAYRAAGMPAHAAASATRAAMHAEARKLWLSFIRPADAAQDAWLGALARFNAGRAAHDAGDEAAAHALYFQSINMLGAAADAREVAGDRDGAFRCYLVMKDIGVRSGAFEDVAEGYINMARILRLKGDRFGTVQAFHDLILSAEEAGELHAAAELYREAGEYARRMGFVYADHFLLNAGRAWRRVAQEAERLGRPVGLVENALLAAVDAFNRTLDPAEVARCYQALGDLELPAARRDRYVALARELMGMTALLPAAQDPAPSLPEYFRRRFNTVDVAVKELLDRESAIDAGACAARLVTDPNLFDVGRRRALNLFLQYDDHITHQGRDAPIPPLLVSAIGEARHPTLVGPLMDLFRRGSVEQRVAAVRAAALMKVREAIGLVDEALAAPRDSEVQVAGVAALRGMTFPHALDALVRIFGHQEDRRIKEIALKNAAIIGTAEAAEFLLDVVRSNAAGLGLVAREALLTHVSEKMRGALESNRRVESNPDVRSFIYKLISQVQRRQETA